MDQPLQSFKQWELNFWQVYLSCTIVWAPNLKCFAAHRKIWCVIYQWSLTSLAFMCQSPTERRCSSYISLDPSALLSIVIFSQYTLFAWLPRCFEDILIVLLFCPLLQVHYIFFSPVFYHSVIMACQTSKCMIDSHHALHTKLFCLFPYAAVCYFPRCPRHMLYMLWKAKCLL